MAKVELSLPDTLVNEATAAGLLTSDRVEDWLQQQLNRKKIEDLFAAMDRMAATGENPLSPSEIAEEIAAMRAERRQTQAP